MRGIRARRRQAPPLDAVRVRVLDGAHVWVTLAVPRAGRLLARSDAGTTTLAPHVPEGFQTLCVPLSLLTGDTDASFELLFDDGRSERPLSVTAADVPTTTPRSPDGRWQYDVEVVDDVVWLRRSLAAASARVIRVGITDGSLEVCWAGEPARQLLVREPGRTGGIAAAVEATYADGRARARLEPELLAGRRGHFRLEARGTENAVPLRRERNGLRRPGESVLMPSVPDGHGGTIALRWSRQGVLQVQCTEAAG